MPITGVSIWLGRSLKNALALAPKDLAVLKNVTARLAEPPAYGGRGRPPKYGDLVRPLARRRKGQEIPATPPDQVTTWTEHDRAGDRTLRAEQWFTLVVPDAAPGSPTFTSLSFPSAPLRTSSQACRNSFADLC